MPPISLASTQQSLTPSLLGRFDGTIEKCDAGILVNGHLVHLFNEKDPS